MTPFGNMTMSMLTFQGGLVFSVVLNCTNVAVDTLLPFQQKSAGAENISTTKYSSPLGTSEEATHFFMHPLRDASKSPLNFACPSSTSVVTKMEVLVPGEILDMNCPAATVLTLSFPVACAWKSSLKWCRLQGRIESGCGWGFVCVSQSFV